MNPKLILLLAVLIISAGFWAIDYRHGVEVPLADKLVLPAMPDIVLTSLEGQEQRYRLSDYRGRHVLINVWASWCTPCVKEFPELLALADSYPERLTLFTISVDETAEDSIRFLQRLPQYDRQPNVIYTWDKKKQVTQQQLHIVRYPESILVTPTGEMRTKFAGGLTAEQLTQIREALGD